MDQPERTLAHVMVEVARLLQTENGVHDTWTAITRLAVERLEGVNHAGVTVVQGGKPRTPASSGELPVQVDALQYQLGQGPCLDAIAHEETFMTGDLGAESARWPAFSRQASQDLGVHSMLSFQLFVQDDTLGALNFYSHRRHAFDDVAVREAGSVFAAHAAIALANAEDQDKVVNLNVALDSSRRIGAAVGVLMARHRLTEQQAFDVLRHHSQNTNRKLRDIADDVVHTGTLPDDERSTGQTGAVHA